MRGFVDHHKQNKIFISLAVAAAVGAVLLIFAENNAFYRDFRAYFSNITPAAAPAESRLANVVIDFGNGTERTFAGRVESGMTIISALRASETSGKFRTAIDARGRVTGIDGVSDTSLKHWSVYLNNELVEGPPGHIEIEAGDQIVFQYK